MTLRRATLALLLALAPLFPAEAGVVRGRVLEKGTEKPIKEARAFVVGSTDIVVSDSTGVFWLKNVPAGLATIRVQVAWHDMWSGSISMGGETDTQKVDVHLTRVPAPGTISGLVTFEAGAKAGRHAHVRVLSNALESVADDDGLFTLYGVPIGEQTLQVMAMGYDPVRVNVRSEEARNSVIKVDLGASLLNASAQRIPAPVASAPDTSLSVRFSLPDTSRSRMASLARMRHVKLEILSADKVVRTLMDWKTIPSDYTVVWDGRDDAGKEAPSGTYRYRLKIDEEAPVEGDLVKQK